MKKIMHFLIIIILTAGTLCTCANNVIASEVYTTGKTTAALVDIQVVDNDGWRMLTKTYETAPDYMPDYSLLIDEPFEYEGYYYTFYYASINEVTREEQKWERTEVNFPIAEDNVTLVYQQLAPSIPYDQDGFSGWLDLDYTAVWTQVEGYEQKSFTMTDTVTVAGLSSNDSSQIEKTRVKSGVTMTLQSVDWKVQESTNIGYDTIPTKYTATAKYSGKYTKSVPTGYIGRALYGGNVVRVSVDKVLYTVSYAGVSLAAPTPEITADTASEAVVPTVMPTSEQTSETAQETAGGADSAAASGSVENNGTNSDKENKTVESSDVDTQAATADSAKTIETVETGENAETDKPAETEEPSDNGNSSIFLMLAVIASLAALAATAIVFYTRWSNVRVYAGDGESYGQIARKRLNDSDPTVAVVDLRRLNLKGGKITVFVNERVASKYNGKKIKTVISNDYNHFHTVNHRNRDFRYTVNIPEADADSGGDSKS